MNIAPMFSKRITITTTTVIVFLSVFSVVRAADTDINSAIEDRRVALKGISKQLKLLSGMAKEEIDYDSGKASAAAVQINEHAASLLKAELWPEGSDLVATQHDGTRAKAVIWEDVDTFLMGFADLEAASKTLSAEAGNGLDALKGSLGAAGKTCKACHQEYRGPKQ